MAKWKHSSIRHKFLPSPPHFFFFFEGNNCSWSLRSLNSIWDEWHRYSLFFPRKRSDGIYDWGFVSLSALLPCFVKFFFSNRQRWIKYLIEAWEKKSALYRNKRFDIFKRFPILLYFSLKREIENSHPLLIMYKMQNFFFYFRTLF